MLAEFLAALIKAALAPFLALLTPGDKAYWFHALLSLLVASLALLRAGETSPLRSLFDRRVWSQRSARIDLRFYFLNGALLTLLFAPLAALQTGVARRIAGELTLRAGAAPSLLEPGLAVSAIVTVVAVLALDFSLFLPHWLQHRVPLLWQFHKVHHSAEVLTPFTAYRFHPVDDVLNVFSIAAIAGTVDGLLLWVFPFEAAALTLQGVNLVTFLFYALGVHLRHSHVWLAYPRSVSQVLVSPAMHQLHHSTDPGHFDKNLGLIFSVWDRLFGTLLVPDGKLQIEFGLGGGEEKEFSSVARLYALPFRKAAALLRRRPGAETPPAYLPRR